MPEWLNVLLRSAVIFFVTLLLVRIAGKKMSSQLTFYDLVTANVIGAIAATFSLSPVLNPSSGLTALLVWALLPALFYLLAMKYKVVRDVFQGRETILINHGKVLEDKLMEARYTPEDLLSQLRRKSVFNFADVEFAVLEPSGDLSVMLKKDKQPLTAKTMGVHVGMEGVPQTVMLDGEIIDEHLTAMGLNRNWLYTELEKAGVAPENVFIAQVDSAGQLYLDLFDDSIQVPNPKTKDLVYATLKKCQADCELYALGTRQPEAKKMYGESSAMLAQAIRELEPLLKR